MSSSLIILYGDVENSCLYDSKIQKLVDGAWTCGYREYAEKFGYIVYMTPVRRATRSWERVFPRGQGLVKFCDSFPGAIVWAVKKGNREKDALLNRISNKKIYYSCGASHSINHLCDISLVDTVGRLNKRGCNSRLWVKGKNSKFWSPAAVTKIYDYVVIGKSKPGKNQKLFINRLARECLIARSVLWIGAGKGSYKNGAHTITCTSMVAPAVVRDLMRLAKVGVLFTQYKNEGFPQSFLELTMCGVPVVYSDTGPYNDAYFSSGNSVITGSKNLVSSSENLLRMVDSVACRNYAVSNYSLDVSFSNLQRLVNCDA